MNKFIKKQRELAGIEESSPYPAWTPRVDAQFAIARFNDALNHVRDSARHIEMALKSMHEGVEALANKQPILKRTMHADMAIALVIRKRLTDLELALTRSETNVRNFAGAHPVPELPKKKVWGIF